MSSTLVVKMTFMYVPKKTLLSSTTGIVTIFLIKYLLNLSCVRFGHPVSNKFGMYDWLKEHLNGQGKFTPKYLHDKRVQHQFISKGEQINLNMLEIINHNYLYCFQFQTTVSVLNVYLLARASENRLVTSLCTDIVSQTIVCVPVKQLLIISIQI